MQIRNKKETSRQLDRRVSDERVREREIETERDDIDKCGHIEVY